MSPDTHWPCPSCGKPGLSKDLYKRTQEMFSAVFGPAIEVQAMTCESCKRSIPTKTERQRAQDN